jgi:Cu/Ag efflux pump CusA
MTQLATEMSRELRSIPGVENVGAHVGRAITGDQVVDVNSSEIWVSIASDAPYAETLDRVEAAAGALPTGVEGDVVSYSTQKLRDVGAVAEGENAVRGDGLDLLTGSDKPLVVRVYGHDTEVLRAEAEKVRRLVAGVDGVVAPRVEVAPAQPSLEIEVDLARAQRLGIKPGDVRRAESTLLQGIHVGSVFEDQKVFDVVVQGRPEMRENVESVRDLLIDRPGGGHVRLGEVADVREVSTPIAIQRDAVARRIDVEAGVSGRALGTVADDIRARLADVAFPLEYHAEVLEETAGAEIGVARMIAFAIAAVIAAFLLLQAAFRSWRLAIAASLALPVALAGGVLAALVSGAELSLGSLLGLLALFALAVRTVVLLIRHLDDADRARGGTLRREAVVSGARARLGPVLASATALAALMLPIVVVGAAPGLEIVQPMAVVILGGLVTATFLTLFVMPAVYLRFGAATQDPDPNARIVRQWPGVEPAPDAPVHDEGNGAAVAPRVPAEDGEPNR